MISLSLFLFTEYSPLNSVLLSPPGKYEFFSFSRFFFFGLIRVSLNSNTLEPPHWSTAEWWLTISGLRTCELLRDDDACAFVHCNYVVYPPTQRRYRGCRSNRSDELSREWRKSADLRRALRKEVIFTTGGRVVRRADYVRNGYLAWGQMNDMND